MIHANLTCENLMREGTCLPCLPPMTCRMGAPLAEKIMHLLHIHALLCRLRDSPRRTSKKQPLGIMRKGSAWVGYAVIYVRASLLSRVGRRASIRKLGGREFAILAVALDEHNTCSYMLRTIPLAAATSKRLL
eukprot:scaffold115059_cov13-Prasinocladus_malaysianus.AAC.1